jgi:hypothetical protein
MTRHLRTATAILYVALAGELAAVAPVNQRARR